MIGRTLSHYRIVNQIGAGGMGVIYRAHDQHLDRDVALKLLPAGTLADDVSRARFRREALALSRLNHPHINAVHDFDSQDGLDFLVMELVPGRTLEQRLLEGRLGEAEAVHLVFQIAGALEAAHEHGVIHRDLKPANVMITPRGDAKVLDFGLAKRVGPATSGATRVTINEAQSLTGTVPYMPPEQLLGGELDARADLYALGVTLFEMVTGRRPFEQEQTFALANAILNDSPPRPRSLAPRLSAGLERVILRCLEKNRDARYPSAKSLIEDLRAPRAQHMPVRRLLTAALAIVMIAIVATLGVVVTRRPSLPPAAGCELLTPRGIRSLAVLPLENLSGDPGQEYFADGMTDELITDLAQIAALRVISRSSAMTYKGTKKRLRDIARELGVDAVVEGTVRRAGDQVRINAQLIDAGSDRNLWAQEYQRASGNILALQNDVASAIADQIRIQLTPQEKARLSTARSVNPEAHEAYLQGRFYFSQYSSTSLRHAAELFNRAIEIDPGYAQAYAGLADAYEGMSSLVIPATEAMPRAKAAAARALELDPNLADAHAALAYVTAFYDWNWKEAEKKFREALVLNPGEVTAHQNLAYLLVVNRRFDEAEVEIRKARSFDPLSPMVAGMSLWPLYQRHRYDQTITEARKLIQADPGYFNSHQILGQALFMKGDHDEALKEMRHALELWDNPLLWAVLGNAYGRTGQRRAAFGVLDSLKQHAKTQFVQPYDMALLYAGLGEKDSAFVWLSRGIDQRSEEMVELMVDPAIEWLRSDPRYLALLKQLGFGS